MEKKTINFAFIGAGMVTEGAAKEVAAHKLGRLQAIYDLHEGRARAVAEASGIARVCASRDELLKDESVDVVYVAVPNRFHAETAIAALEAGKHVILEKPFAMNYEEALQVAETARAKKLSLLIGMNNRYNVNAHKLRRMIGQGDLGDIYHAKAFWFRRRGIPKLGTWFGNKALSGGGCLNDIGVHLLDLCLYTIGNFEPVRVSGQTYTVFGNRGLGEGGWGRSDAENITFNVDDFATALIKMKNGATVSLDLSWAAHIPESNRMDVQLFGSEMGASLMPPKLLSPLPNRSAYAIEEGFTADADGIPVNRFHNMIDHLIGGQELLVKVEEALVVQKILDAVQKSSESGTEQIL